MNRKTKDIDIAWIGNIPESWKIEKIKYNLKEINEKNNPIKTENILSLIKDIGIIPYSEKGEKGNKSKDDITGYKLAYKNDLVLNSMNVVIGSVGISNYFGAVSPVYYVLREIENKTNIKYVNYIFQTREFQKYLTQLGKGILEIREKISITDLKNTFISIPSIKEQKKIIEILDKKCLIIENIIKENKKSIKQIEDYRKQSINTVTIKGIDKTKEMKDTGINWIGSIPFDWKVEKLKFNIKTRNDKVELNNNIYVGLENIENNTGKYIESNTEYENGIYDYFEKHDILFNKLRPYLTKCLYTSFNGCCTGELEIIEKFKGYKKYLFYFLISNRFIDIVNSSTYGTKMPRANWSFIKELPIILPSFEEQKQIAEHLDKKCLQTDKVISKRKELIEKLEEYKKSLIYEVVTGKIEI